MYLRYELTVRYGDYYIFQKSFKSINQVIKVASGFNCEDPKVYMFIYDDLHQNVIAYSQLKSLIKEFWYD